MTILLAIMGATLVIFGAIFTATGSDYVGTYYGYPIWSLPGLPAAASISANYTLNYVGFGFLVAAIAISLVSRSSGRKLSIPAEVQ